MKTTIKDIPITKLKPAPYNPRTIDEDAVKALAASMDHFGLVVPLVWNKRTGHVVGGNQRLAILKNSKRKTLPCSVVDLTLKQEKILNLRLNNLSGEWNYDDLSKILKAIGKDEWQFTGFKEFEIEKLVLDEFGGAVAHKSLAEQFGVPPFSVLDARQGYWQDRKRAWLALGIQSEIGRGGSRPHGKDTRPISDSGRGKYKGGDCWKDTGGKETMAMHNDQMQRKTKYDGRKASPGGSLMPAANYSKTGARGDGKGRPIK